MELPNEAKAYISTSKIIDYLLSETHAVGKSKSKFFRSFGFDETNIIQFGQGLIKIAQTEEVTATTENLYGTKYIIDGELETPNGVTIYLRTVWTSKMAIIFPDWSRLIRLSKSRSRNVQRT
jgi:hypothetical protein